MFHGDTGKQENRAMSGQLLKAAAGVFKLNAKHAFLVISVLQQEAMYRV